jgi:hypothetical protein
MQSAKSLDWTLVGVRQHYFFSVFIGIFETRSTRTARPILRRQDADVDGAVK